MMRHPRWFRLRLKLFLCEFAMVGAAQIADDEAMPARQRIPAAWHTKWLIRYALRLRKLITETDNG